MDLFDLFGSRCSCVIEGFKNRSFRTWSLADGWSPRVRQPPLWTLWWIPSSSWSRERLFSEATRAGSPIAQSPARKKLAGAQPMHSHVRRGVHRSRLQRRRCALRQVRQVTWQRPMVVRSRRISWSAAPVADTLTCSAMTVSEPCACDLIWSVAFDTGIEDHGALVFHRHGMQGPFGALPGAKPLQR